MAAAMTLLQALLLLLAVRGSWQHHCVPPGPVDLGRVLTPDAIPFITPLTLGNLSIQNIGGVTVRQSDFCSGEHIGTHLDVPYHVIEDGWTVPDIPVCRLIAEGVFMNFTNETNNDVTFRLQPSHINGWLEEHGPLPDNCMVLISFGWAQLYDNKTAFRGSTSDVPSTFTYPGIGDDAARLLASFPQIVGIGVDTLSGDPSGTMNVHVILSEKQIYIVEQADLDKPCIPPKGFKVISMPVDLVHASAAPARVILVPYHSWHRHPGATPGHC